MCPQWKKPLENETDLKTNSKHKYVYKIKTIEYFFQTFDKKNDGLSFGKHLPSFGIRQLTPNEMNDWILLEIIHSLNQNIKILSK